MKRILLPILLLSWLAPAHSARLQNDRAMGLRLIVVSSDALASRIRDRILKGESFETLAREHSTDNSAPNGGYLGVFASTDLRQEFQSALTALKPGEVSPVIRIGNEFALLQIASGEQKSESSEAQSLLARWGSLEVLERFANLLNLAYFRDDQFQEALEDYDEAVKRASLSENLYLAMTNLLSQAELREEAASLMVHAVSAYPNSRQVRYRLAELHRDSGKMIKALEVFKEASTLEARAGTDAAVDRRQRSFIYQRMGGINTDLVQFDDAVAAYKTALEIDPANGDARLSLADLYLQRNMVDSALSECSRVAAEYPGSATVHNRLAEIYLRMGRLSDAAAAAGKALEIDPSHRRSSYVRMSTLMRMGREDEAQKQLEHYEKLETAAQAQANEIRRIATTNRGAADLWIKGEGKKAMELLAQGVETHPQAFSIYRNLGVAQAKMGLHRESIKTFETILALGHTGNFLVHLNLAREHETLGDMAAAKQHRALYLDLLDATLEAGLN